MKIKTRHRILVKLLVYTSLVIMAVVILPFILVRGCMYGPDKSDAGDDDLRSGVMLKVWFHKEEQVRSMDLEEYIVGVTAAEMPAYFEPEALKAQAVAARTYAYGRLAGLFNRSADVHKGADVCTNPGHCQAWISKKDAYRNWGVFFPWKNWERVRKAVQDTKNIILTYNGAAVNPLYSSNSGGRTENAEDVWNCDPVAYLKSVESYGDRFAPDFTSEAEILVERFVTTLKSLYPSLELTTEDLGSQIQISGFTEGGSVKDIIIGNITISGVRFREIFSLRSAKFDYKNIKNNKIIFTVTGNGHGVGMSQWGANYLAKNGGTYEEILKYYFKDVILQALPQQ